MKITTAELEAHLHALYKGVKSGDTVEGAIAFMQLDETCWELEAAYRTGALVDHGTMVIVKPSKNIARA